MAFAYNPVTGLLDIATYPTSPVNETAARQQFMDLFNQARDYMNNSLALKNPTATWTAPTLLNSWINFGGSYETAQYRKDELGYVTIKGVVKGGTTNISTGIAIFTLPVGYRPLAFRPFAQININDNTITRIDVRPTGEIMISTASSATTLDIKFFAEQ